MIDLAIIDGCGANLTSLTNALTRLNTKPVITDRPETIFDAAKVILPGVGASGTVMNRLSRRGLDKVIPNLTQPVLGICVGMQVLFQSTEEDDAQCLGIIPGRLKRLKRDRRHPVPHMGWNQVESNHKLFRDIRPTDHCYFVHSYAAPVDDSTIARCGYSELFAAAVEWKNFLGVQFHPERSGHVGSAILKNFLTQES